MSSVQQHANEPTQQEEIVERLGLDEPSAEEIGNRIAGLRKDKGLSLSELASSAAVSKSYLSTVEKGSGSRPGAAFLHKIAQALGVTLADLVGREIVAVTSAISPALREFAVERSLPRGDIEMLAGIAFRGEAPKTKQRWEFIYRAIKSSADMDSEGS